MMDRIAAFVNYPILDNPLWLWALAIVVLGVAWKVFEWLQKFGVKMLRRMAVGSRERVMNLLADLLDHTHRFVLFLLALNVATYLLTLPKGQMLFPKLLGVTLLVQAGIWANALINFYLDDLKKRKLQDDPATVTTLSALGFIAKLACYVSIFLVGWKVVTGTEPTALIAGLGVGGLAIGLAAQNILGDLFASMTIVLDKPFVIGDFIIVGDFLGSVEYIGLKSTRLRSLSGEQLVFSNQDLLSSRIRNYKRMFERRIVFKIGVTYQTPAEKLEKIPGMIRAIIETQDQTRFDRSHFAAYGDFALIVESVYYVLAPEYGVYMDKQQAINLAIYEQFKKEGIEFAYPTQTLYVNKADGDEDARPSLMVVPKKPPQGDSSP